MNTVKKTILLTLLVTCLQGQDNVSLKANEVAKNSFYKEDAKKILSIPWGDNKEQLTPIKDFWFPTYHYFYVNGKSVFIQDKQKKTIQYYQNGKYKKSFANKSSLFGLIANDDTLYLFKEFGKSLALSIKTGLVIYSRSFEKFMSKGLTVIYKHGEIFVIMTRAKVYKCLDTKLKEIQCPVNIKSRTGNKFSDYQYIEPNFIVSEGSGYKKGKELVRFKLLDQDTLRVLKDVYYDNKSKADTDQSCIIKKEGIYEAVDTEKGVEIWFTPWGNLNQN